MRRKLKDYMVISLKGLAMGAADVVPGVSGGTIAFISGIYEELLGAISAINIGLFKTLKSKGISAAWKQLNGHFLLSLFLGIFISIISLAKVVKWLLENEPVLLWSFFFGLVLASIFYVGKQIAKWNLQIIVIGIVGIILGYMVTIIPPIDSQTNDVLLIFAGAIASCAMILPGISGSYILLLIGFYSFIIEAIDTIDLKILFLFMVGVVIGLVSFSKVLKWLFSKFRNQMMAILTGIMLGSLNKIWPWKIALSTYTDSHGKIKPLLEKSISPFTFDGDAQLLYAIILAVIGFSFIVLLEKLAVTKKSNGTGKDVFTKA
ncbi:MAG: DUF368 domain-containing protein [Flavobacteriaceae bacterium]|nr:MAG: DUF368 domain-containing protein [Flavobacteriaceae bacterium]